MIGREIGSWTAEQKLGEGGMGEVFLARHRTLGTPIVVKVLSGLLTHDEKFRARFFQEARTQAQLRHPHIAQVLDYVEQDGQWFLVIEHLPGGTLADVLEKTGGPIAIPRALRWAEQALDALDLAHRRGIIHRDVKPTNLLLDEYDRLKVSDFGIAVVVGGRRLTTTGQALGTPQYMSPEQIKRPDAVDHRTDVYSMGVVLYELLTGRVPFDSEVDFEIRQAQVTAAPPRPRKLNPEIPEDLEEIVLRALAKDPDQRFSGCGEFLRALQASASRPEVATATEGGDAGPPEPAGGSSAADERRDPSRYRRLFGCATGVLVLILIGMLVGLVLMTSHESDRRNAAVAEAAQLRREKEKVLELARARAWPLVTFNGFDSSRDWGTGPEDSELLRGSRRITEGVYRWQAEAKKGFIWWQTVVNDNKDFYLSVELLIPADSERARGALVFRRDGEGNYYVFQITKKSCRVSVWHEDSWVTLEGDKASRAIKPESWNRLSVIGVNSDFSFFINEVFVASITNDLIEKGAYGLGIELDSGDSATFEFDNFELRRFPGK